MPFPGVIMAVLAILLGIATAAPSPLESIKNCTLVPTPWADGDSFQVRKPDGSLLTVRLYAADCIEWHITDDADSSRQRAQRRYFGITAARGSTAASIALAKEFGEKAARLTTSLLARPFTLHTRNQRALGDSKHLRFYAFIETADGKDLASELVRTGLARAQGVSADGPAGRSREAYRELLADLELQAAKRGRGIWEFTDWDKLPAERDVQRREDEEDQIAQSPAPLPADFRVDPNTAGRDALTRLPGVGEALADRIIEAREDQPFRKPEDLMRVPGIKERTLDKLRPHLQFARP
jgi:endonuclease YncB( thermonuclease family)